MSEEAGTVRHSLVLPPIGSRWVWEPLKPYARDIVKVTGIRFNGEEWWVTSEGKDGKSYPNPLDRWVEATVCIGEDEPDPDLIDEKWWHFVDGTCGLAAYRTPGIDPETKEDLIKIIIEARRRAKTYRIGG